MTKKDYKEIAEVVRSYTVYNRDLEMRYLDRDELIVGLSVLMAKDNPRFDAERFRAACYGDPFKK